MADRALLHVNKLEEFKQWLENNSAVKVLKPKGAFEELRWERTFAEYKGTMPIVFRKGGEHLTCNEASVPFVRQFIKERQSESTHLRP